MIAVEIPCYRDGKQNGDRNYSEGSKQAAEMKFMRHAGARNRRVRHHAMPNGPVLTTRRHYCGSTCLETGHLPHPFVLPTVDVAGMFTIVSIPHAGWLLVRYAFSFLNAAAAARITVSASANSSDWNAFFSIKYPIG
jgi:hypothetical protein